MENNTTTLRPNVTISKFFEYINISMAKWNTTSEKDMSKIHLFDLYEAYKTQEKEQLMTYKFVAYVLGTLIVLSNLVVVISSGLILKKGQQPKSTYLLLGNVSLADTIIGISIIFGASVDANISSDPLCIFQIGMIVCPAMVSIFSVGLIAVDRYIYILHGLYYQRWFNTTRVRIGILCIWLVGIVLGFAPLSGWVNTEHNMRVSSHCVYITVFPGLFIASLPAMGWTGETFRDYRCWYISVFPPSLLVILSCIVLLIIITVCILYVCILRSAVKTVDRIREFKASNIAYVNKAYEEDNNKISKTTVKIIVERKTVTQKDLIEMHEVSKENIEQKRIENGLKQNASKITCYNRKVKAVSSSPTKLKAVKTVLLVIFCFVGTWAPYYVAVIVYVKCDIMEHGYDCIPLEVLTLGPLYLLGVSNSLLDPVIYAWRHSGFKRSLKRIYLRYIRKQVW